MRRMPQNNICRVCLNLQALFVMNISTMMNADISL